MVRINPFVEAYVYKSKGDVLIYVDGISQGTVPISDFINGFSFNAGNVEEQVKMQLSKKYNTNNVYVILYL